MFTCVHIGVQLLIRIESTAWKSSHEPFAWIMERFLFGSSFPPKLSVMEFFFNSVWVFSLLLFRILVLSMVRTFLSLMEAWQKCAIRQMRRKMRKMKYWQKGMRFREGKLTGERLKKMREWMRRGERKCRSTSPSGKIHKWKIHGCKELFCSVADTGLRRSDPCIATQTDTGPVAVLEQLNTDQKKPFKQQQREQDRQAAFGFGKKKVLILMLEWNTLRWNDKGYEQSLTVLFDATSFLYLPGILITLIPNCTSGHHA